MPCLYVPLGGLKVAMLKNATVDRADMPNKERWHRLLTAQACQPGPLLDCLIQRWLVTRVWIGECQDRAVERARY